MTDNDLHGLRTRADGALRRAERAREQGDYAGAVIAEGDARRYMSRIVAEQHARADRRKAA